MGIAVKTGDITKERACAVVNAANSSLMGGGGVDGAIHRAGGSKILQECRELRRTKYPDGLPTGEAAVTTAGDLPAKYVIHTVGPIWGRCKKRCDELLADAYRNSLERAVEVGCRSVLFPAISTGIYGFPPERAAKIAYRTVREFLKRHPDMDVTFIFHSDESRRVFEEANGL
ncbi:macro domain, possibly ADP-ribose binding module [Hydrogenimonas sp.]|nr:macro domain, possibly ADP-ribose binding module [Hydrogenimonas sp.]